MAQLQQVLREPVAAPVLSPEDVRRRRQIALEMQNAGMQTTPVQHWTQGLARVAQALAGQYEDAQATKAEEEGRSSARRSIAELLAPQAPDAPSQAPEARIGQIMSAMDNPWLGEGQRAALTQMAATDYKKFGAQESPFDGTSMDAQVANILIEAEKNPAIKDTPRYRMAVNLYEQPKVVPDGQGGFTVTRPTIPFGQPSGSAPPATGASPPVPAKNTQPSNISVSGANITRIPGGVRVPTNYRLGPDGETVVPIPGGPEDPAVKGFSEAQGKANIFGTRAEAAEKILQTHGTALMDPVQLGVGQIPIAGNYMVSPEYQQADQAQRDMINAFLRRESGAVISPQEFSNAYRQYIPAPGDSKEVLAQKAANRKAQIDALLVEAGPAYAVTKSRASAPQSSGATSSPSRQPASQPQTDGGSMPIVRTQKEFDALKSGTRYREEDGQIYYKP